MTWFIKRSLIFYLFFNFEVSIAKPSGSTFIERPADCAQSGLSPCDISSGLKSYQFSNDGAQWEMAKGTVLRRYDQKTWKIASGQFVVQAKRPLTIETPFGLIRLEGAKAYIDLQSKNVEVSVLSGKPALLVSRVPGHQFWIHPGMKKWISGLGPEGLEVGETQVIDVKVYARSRVEFFSDYKQGFTNELSLLAKEVQKATQVLAYSYKKNVENKMAMLITKLRIYNKISSQSEVNL